ncbi:hypothetical protein SEVIR_2G068201v4 [Setaria viridis]|uniref:F-box domain-containing protein n=1 Tax=Setaria italica TaxID=4555 RepID=K3ZY27_SETIT|nr:uncharacterized protein LOC105913861 [Setaria italica]XP_034579788.1 uncharacterized protein LOC117843329 [Setaria viridis]
MENGLPDDPLAEILSRVPAKSLCRFKCVSKSWRDLIAGRLRCRRFPQTLQGFIYGDGEAHVGYIVCNPATEQWVAVPSSGWSPWPDSKAEEDEDYFTEEDVLTHLISIQLSPRTFSWSSYGRKVTGNW